MGKAGGKRVCAYEGESDGEREGRHGRRESFVRKIVDEDVHDDTIRAKKIKARRDNDGDNNAMSDDRRGTKEQA